MWQVKNADSAHETLIEVSLCIFLSFHNSLDRWYNKWVQTDVHGGYRYKGKSHLVCMCF